MNVIELTRELIAIPSVNPRSAPGDCAEPGETALADRVEAILLNLGAVQMNRWEPLEGRPVVTGYINFHAPETVIFDAHLDTVPIDGMTVDPFGGEMRDGKIYGRGACDIKGPMAAMFCALEDVRKAANDNKITPRYNVLFAAVCDEESGFAGVGSFVDRLDKSAYAPITGAIVAEPTLLNPVVAHKGAARWIVSVAGIAAHSSTPHLGDNAIYKIAPVIERLKLYADKLAAKQPHARLGVPSLSIGIIRGGSAVNIVPDYCEVQVDRRLIPGETLEQANEDVKRELAGLNVVVSDPTVAAEPMETSEDHPLAQAALAAAKTAGAAPEFEYATYCTDASLYPQIAVPTVVFGPGSIAQAHTKDEWIETKQLEMGVKAYAALLQ